MNKVAINPECVTPRQAIVYCAATVVTVATSMVVGILSVPTALLRFKMRVSWNATNGWPSGWAVLRR